MADLRLDRLADILTSHSTRIKRGERVLIDLCDAPQDIAIALIRSVRKRGGYPFINLQSNVITRELLRGAEEEQYRTLREYEIARMKMMDAYIAVRGSYNTSEFSDVATEQMQLAMKTLQPVVDHRVNKTKWVVLRWPTPSMAQMAGVSTEAFENFYFNVCTLDYGRMKSGMENLKSLMQSADKVHVTGNATDLRFSIKGIPAVVCGGEHNIPDGEVFTCPLRDSAEGYVRFNAPTVYQGTAFDSVRLAFKSGKIVEAKSNNTERLNAILNSDEGARYIGEFSLGFNPHIREPMRDILFDEKICGSFHLTPGQAYERADNGNRSQVHWDLVCIQRPEYGGGEIYFDDKLIRKDGQFIPKELQSLNPESFKA
jgi:aminopeptidase